MNELIALALLAIPVVVLQALILLELRKIRRAIGAAAYLGHADERAFIPEAVEALTELSLRKGQER